MHANAAHALPRTFAASHFLYLLMLRATDGKTRGGRKEGDVDAVGLGPLATGVPATGGGVFTQTNKQPRAGERKQRIEVARPAKRSPVAKLAYLCEGFGGISER